MNQASAAELATREHADTYVDPYLGISLGEAKSIVAVTQADDIMTVVLEFGFPCADYHDELASALESHLAPLGLGQRLNLVLRANIQPHAVQNTLKPLTEVVSANPRRRPTWRSPGRSRVPGWACWMRTSTDPASRS